MQEIPWMKQKQQYRLNYKYVGDTMDEAETIVQTKLEICRRYNG